MICSSSRAARVAAAALLGLAAGCGSAPTVEATVPLAGATDAPANVVVTATFSEELDPASVTGAGFTLTNLDSGAAVAGSVKAVGRVATFDPAADLPPLARFRASIGGARSKAGAAMERAFEWTFTTQATPLSISSSDPANGATGVPVSSLVRLTFSEDVQPATVTSATVAVRDGASSPISGALSVAGPVVTFTPSANLAVREQYSVTVTRGVLGVGGGALPSDQTLRFSTTMGAVTNGIGGRVTYDWVPALDPSEGGPKLGYSGTWARPARRVVVEALDASNTSVSLGKASTDDDGYYLIPLANGANAVLRAYARVEETAGYVADGIPPDHCTGGTWHVSVVDNTSGKAEYAIQAAGAVMAPAADVDLHAATTVTSGHYTSRSGAPFALADDAVSAIEKICEGQPAPSLPVIYMNWSPNNVPSSGSRDLGQIGTSFYTQEAGVSNLYILGKEDVDTDEYDDHVVAHEFGHYLEDRLYRSDSIGGMHYLGSDLLDPRVAFSEGYANAMSALVLDDPGYVDTSGTGQSGGFGFSMATAPTGNDRGVYSELSVAHMLYALYLNRGAAGSYDRIHDVLASYQKTSPALTTVQTFASYYNQVYGGSADGLRSLWVDVLDGDYDSLCPGACAGAGDTADPFDADNDLGIHYATTRTYYGAAKAAQFWRLYKDLTGSGFAAPGDAHDVVVGTSRGANKYGVQRWYRYVAPSGGTKTITIDLPSVCGGGTQPDQLDMYVWDHGDDLSGYDAATSLTCESYPLAASAGRTYVVVVGGWTSDGPDVNGFGVRIQ